MLTGYIGYQPHYMHGMHGSDRADMWPSMPPLLIPHPVHGCTQPAVLGALYAGALVMVVVKAV
jgi:hypothetical protein